MCGYTTMTLRKIRRAVNYQRKNAIKRFRKERLINHLAKPGIHDFIIVLDHLKPLYNIGKIFRSADAFGAREVHLVGIDFFDPAPAMGSFKWVPAKFHQEFATCYKELIQNGYALFTMDPSGGDALATVGIPARSAFIFGHEEYGFSFNPDEYGGMQSVLIPQVGKVDSLNVSIAASIVMYEYLRQHKKS